MRIGVAVSVPEPWGTQIQAWRESFGDPMARSIPAHVTLLPPTAVARHDVLGVHDHLLRVACAFEPFHLHLDGTDTFRPVSPVVFLKVTRGAGACDRLQRTVRTGPLARDLTFPYHPHVTVAHHVDEASLDQALTTLHEFSATFLVHSFCLYEHGADDVWRPKHLYAFG
jgi:2'-5' RNA ligase